MSTQSVIVLQTANPAFVKLAMEEILGKGLLGPVRITLFCRALPDEQAQFQGLSWVGSLYVHDEGRGALEHLRQIRRTRYDVAVVFFTGDPSYWKLKCFAFLCGWRHLLIFNEHRGCFFFTPAAYASFLKSRYKEWRLRFRQRLGYALGTPQGYVERRPSPLIGFLRPLHLLLKMLIFPFRFLYLLAWASANSVRRKRYLKRNGHRLQFRIGSDGPMPG